MGEILRHQIRSGDEQIRRPEFNCGVMPATKHSPDDRGMPCHIPEGSDDIGFCSMHHAAEEQTHRKKTKNEDRAFSLRPFDCQNLLTLIMFDQLGYV